MALRKSGNDKKGLRPRMIGKFNLGEASHAAFNMLSSSPETSISIPDRPQSARSMSSNSSISSGVSLTRRSRTRTRSRTVTGPPNPSVDSTSQPDVIPRVPPRVPNTLNPQPSTSNRSLASHAAAVGEVTLVACLPQSSPMPLKLVCEALSQESAEEFHTDFQHLLNSQKPPSSPPI